MRHPPERRNIHNIGHCARFVDHRRRKSQQDACWLMPGTTATNSRGCQTDFNTAGMLRKDRPVPVAQAIKNNGLQVFSAKPLLCSALRPGILPVPA
jgi:hypothetical protein